MILKILRSNYELSESLVDVILTMKNKGWTREGVIQTDDNFYRFQQINFLNDKEKKFFDRFYEKVGSKWVR